MAKTDWTLEDVVKPEDMNRIGQEINQAQTSADNASAAAFAVHAAIDEHAATTTGVHGATSAATPNTLVQRDPTGRFKAAVPIESDDVARKAETDAALSTANNAASAISTHAARTDNPHKTTAAQVGAMPITANDAISAVSAHAARTDNPHSVTKEQVGLGNVENYGVATQAEAEAGTASDKYMTPERVKQAIEKNGILNHGNQVITKNENTGTPVVLELRNKSNDWTESKKGVALLFGRGTGSTNHNYGRIEGNIESANGNLGKLEIFPGCASTPGLSVQNNQVFATKPLYLRHSGDSGIDFGTDPKLAGAIGIFPGWPSGTERLYINTYSNYGTKRTTRAQGVEIGGPVYIRGNGYFIQDSGGRTLDLQNGDLTGVNGIFFNDASDTDGEGLFFLKSGKTQGSTNASDYDVLKVLDGKIYLNGKELFDPTMMTANFFAGGNGASSVNIPANSYANIYTLSGRGVLNEFYLFVALTVGSTSYSIYPSIVVDGKETNLGTVSGTSASAAYGAGYYGITGSTSAFNGMVEIHSPIKFTSSIVFRLKNSTTSAQGVYCTYRGVYYT